MSLIHQALKKLDGTRGRESAFLNGNGALTAGRPRLPAWSYAVLSAVLVIAGAGAYAVTAYSPGPGARVAGDASVSASVPQSTEPAADSFVPAVKPVSALDAIELATKGASLYETGMYVEAAEVYGLAAEAAPEDPAVANNRATALMMAGSTAAAETEFKRALSLRPRYAEAMNNLGVLKAGIGEKAAALDLFARAAAASPRYPDPHLSSAVVLEGEGRLNEALDSYDRFLELAPANDTSRIERVRMKTAELRSILAVAGGGGRP